MDIIQPRDSAELREAMRLLVDGPDLRPAEVDRRVDGLLEYMNLRGLSTDHCLVAKESGRMTAVCLCIDSPGRTTSIFAPVRKNVDDIADVLVQLVEESARLAADRQIQLLQALLPPEAAGEASIYRRAGFTLTAPLIYVETDLIEPVLVDKKTPEVSWVTYNRQTHDLFCRVVLGTYEDSLDCGSLNGVRHIEDILASHRATGVFDPAFWLVGLADDEPVGSILLARVMERSAYEVVYMGLLPMWRGRGYGSSLLRRGVELAREEGVQKLVLAVDARNTPARALYDRFGFRETSRRDAWIRILKSHGEL